MNEKIIDSPGSDDRLVERLIELTDRDPAVPADGADRIKDAIRPLWRDQVRRRAARRRLAWGAVAATAALAIVASLARREDAIPAQTVGHVVLVRGTLRVEGRDGSVRASGPTSVLREGDRLRTGPDNRASLAFGPSLTVRLDSTSTVRVETARILVLDGGAVYLDSGGASTVEVRTPLGVVRDVGTRFEVRHERGATRVRVRDGTVFVVARGDTKRVNRGGELTVSKSGWRAAPVEPSASAWGWVLDVSPPFPIEGKTVAAFLAWIESETGLGIEYEDPVAEQIAREAVLHGELGNVRPDQAPAAVLPSAGLEAAIEHGALRVRRAGTTDKRPPSGRFQKEES